MNLLEAARRTCPESPFVQMSTNKVYGDLPNTIPLKELEPRWDYEDATYEHGIPETFSIDHSKHSLFGASKVAADVMVQEYGLYFGMPTCCLRGGCFLSSDIDVPKMRMRWDVLRMVDSVGQVAHAGPLSILVGDERVLL